MFLDFIKEYWYYFVYGFELLSVLCLSVILFFKNKNLKLINIVESAIQEAEKLGGTAEQKKMYAVALVRQEIKVKYSKLSHLIEKFIDFSKNVNAQKNKTIQEVLSDEFKS